MFGSDKLSTINEENESEISVSTRTRTKNSNDDITKKTRTGYASNPSIFSKTSDIKNNSSSLRCFKEIFMSNSSLMAQPLYHFPDLKDPGIEDAFNDTGVQSPENDECEKYRKRCKDLEIYPLTRVCKSLAVQELNLKYYVLSDKHMSAVCFTLSQNNVIKELNLQDNWLSEESCGYLANVLEVNTMLRVLKMKECRIGVQGMIALAKALAQSYIEELDLSYNSIEDEGLKEGKKALAENFHLTTLNLSNNNLTEKSAVLLAEILTESANLQVLDLSWNALHSFYALNALSRGLLKSKIHWLNLAWNAISLVKAVEPLGIYLTRQKNLTFIDLSNNLLKGAAFDIIKKGITESKSLQHVKIGNNQFSADDAFDFALLLVKAKNTKPLRILDMENMVIHKRFLNLVQELKVQGKEVIHGTILSNYEIYGPYVPKVLFERCRYLGLKPKKKRRRVNFGHFVLALPRNPISSDEFKIILKKKKLIKLLDSDLVLGLQEQYMRKKSGKIDCERLVNDYLTLYPDTEPEPPKKKRKIKGKKGIRERKNMITSQTDLTKEKIEEIPVKVESTNTNLRNIQNPSMTNDTFEKKILKEEKSIEKQESNLNDEVSTGVELMEEGLKKKNKRKRLRKKKDDNIIKKKEKLNKQENLDPRKKSEETMKVLDSKKINSDNKLNASKVFILENEAQS